MIDTTDTQEFIVDSVEVLYRYSPRSLHEFRAGAINGFENSIYRIKREPPFDCSLEGLDKYTHKSALAELLCFLPGKKVMSEFGEDMLYWCWINNVCGKERENALDSISKTLGKDPIIAERARLAVWRMFRSSKTKHVKKAVELFNSLESGISCIDLSRLLFDSSNPGVKLSSGRVKEYSLKSLSPLNDNMECGYEKNWGSLKLGDRFEHRVYLDGPVGIGLVYRGHPQAVVSFAPSDENTLIVLQVQGTVPVMVNTLGGVIALGHSRGLAPFDWRKLMVSFAEETAKKNDFFNLGIQGAVNNKWIHSHKGKIYFPLERALKCYDEQAARLGFEKRGDGNWYRPISQK